VKIIVLLDYIQHHSKSPQILRRLLAAVSSQTFPLRLRLGHCDQEGFFDDVHAKTGSLCPRENFRYIPTRRATSPFRVIAISKSSLVNKTVKRAKLKKFAPKSASTIDRYIGARMREQRLALSMSQHQLGKELGVSFQQIQKYESGKNRVSAARLFEICKALNVSLASMFERDPIRKREIRS
jgi:DNA-binding XRE family transcriptional regulator